MAHWASSGKYPGIGFLCICVDPDARRTAEDFGQQYFQFAPDSLVNGFIEDQSDFPNFQSQLGCQGFIIIDTATFKIVTPRTLAWMQHRDGAFRDLEGKLSKFIERADQKGKRGESEVISPKQNSNEGLDAELDYGKCVNSVASVGHAVMDDQHKHCIGLLSILSQKLSLQALQNVQLELASHFAEEERLLREAGFGGAACDCKNDFSALGSHIADHKRMTSLANDTLAKIGSACDLVDANGCLVPKKLAAELCNAFMDHAGMYDSLYEGKLIDHVETKELPQAIRAEL